ncbi:hypothetical protein Tco_1539167 [Tanacetum coccineum]
MCTISYSSQSGTVSASSPSSSLVALIYISYLFQPLSHYKMRHILILDLLHRGNSVGNHRKLMTMIRGPAAATEEDERLFWWLVNAYCFNPTILAAQ